MAQAKRRWWSLWGGKETQPESPAPQSQPPQTEAPQSQPLDSPPPESPQAPEPQVRAPEAVSHAFEDLMGRYEALLGQSQGSAGSMAVVHRLLTEAEREASNMKVRARRQAEVEAAPLLAEAKRQAQDTIAQANRQAQRITEQQVQSILDDAQRKAQLIEERAKQAAQLFLMRCREDVQSFVAMEAKEAFYKLLAPVNEVLATAQEVEGAWKMRAVDLWGSAAGQLEDYQSTLFGSLGTGQAEALADDSLVHEAVEAPVDDEVAEPETQAREEPSVETEARIEHVVPLEATAPDEATLTDEVPAVELEEPPAPKSDPQVAPVETAAVDEAPVETPAIEEASVETAAVDEATVETPAADEAPVEAAAVDDAALAPGAAEETAEDTEAEQQPAKPEGRGGRGSGSRSGRARDRVAKATMPVPPPDMYEGELDLLVEPYTNVAMISKFYRDLSTVAGIRVLRTAGTWDKGTVITVLLEEPMSPPSLDQRLPADVQVSPVKAEGEGWWKSAIGRRGKAGAHNAIAIEFTPATKTDASQPGAVGSPMAGDGPAGESGR